MPDVRRRGLRLALAIAGAVAALALVVAAARGGGALDVPTAILLGLVEGLTEFVPVSSTGHLTVVERLLGVKGSAADAYVIVIQAGAILAVLILYWRRIASIVAGVRGTSASGRHLAGALALAFLPAAAFGFAFGDTIKDHLFGVGPIAFAWAVGGVFILAVDRRRWPRRQTLETLSMRAAALIGGAQVLALWPGVSRSLVTIAAGLAVGLTMPAAVEFSFLLGLVTLGAATAYEAVGKGGDIIATYGVLAPLLGFLAAFVSAVVAIRWMVHYLERHGLRIFGYYRLAVAAVAAVLLLTGAV